MNEEKPVVCPVCGRRFGHFTNDDVFETEEFTSRPNQWGGRTHVSPGPVSVECLPGMVCSQCTKADERGCL